jgi:hypothetical protein
MCQNVRHKQSRGMGRQLYMGETARRANHVLLRAAPLDLA